MRLAEGGRREGLRLKGKEVEEMGIRTRTATPRRDWEGNDDAMGFSLILAWEYRSQILSVAEP